MPLTILNDAQIEGLLENLTLDDFEGFKHALAQTLHDYSNNTATLEDGSYHQPDRTTTLNPQTGAATLYMPSSSPAGMGCKVVTLSASNSTKPPIQPTGAITLLSPTGQAVGFVHARTLTAFRTALASACLLAKRATVRTITAFGSGLQAYWHIRLALMTRGPTVRQVNIIARGFSDRTKNILRQLHGVPDDIKEREGWTAATFNILTPGYGEYDRLLREHMHDADVVFCCVPSRQSLFDADVLTSHEGRRKGRLVVAVGSYTPDMRELPRELLLQATKRHGSHLHFHKHAPNGGVVVVDTIDGVMKESGEIIEAGLRPDQLIELGELVELHRQHQKPEAKKDEQLVEWLRDGTVIYKSVGLGLMDLSVGTHLVKYATEKGVGTRIDDF